MTKKSLTRLLLALAMTLLLVSAWGYYQVAQAEGDGPMTCQNGMAGQYPCDGIDYLSFMSIEELGGTMGAGSAANLWGWTDPETEKEYVIFGLTDTTAFVDVTDPLSPTLIGNLPTQTVTSDKYRDMKVYENYAFIIADNFSDHGMQVFDLTQLRDVMTPTMTFTSTAHFDGFGDAHNIHINAETGYAYVMRTTVPELCSSAVYMVNIQDPLNPTDAGCINDGGPASDTMCIVYQGDDMDYQGKEICATASDDDMVVHDVSDKANPELLATRTYDNIARSHNVWFTSDHNYAVSSDMNDEMMLGLNTRIFIWDFRDLDDPQLLNIYTSEDLAASDHNVWLDDDYVYIGNFRAGLRMLDASDIANGNLTEGPYFDIIPEDNDTGHSAGAWAVYPFFESGTIAISDKTVGMYLVERSEGVTAVSVNSLESPSNSSGLALAAFALAAGLLALAGVTVRRSLR